MILAATSLVLFGFLYCTHQETSASLKIGVLFDETGALGEFGRTGLLGARLALQQVNAAGGVLGRPVELASADAATDVEITVAQARKLIELDGVHAIIGPLGSDAALAVSERVIVPARVPLVSPTATTPHLTRLDDDGFFFRTTASDAVQAPVLARLAAEQGYQRVAVLFQNDSYGQALSEAFIASFPGQAWSFPIDRIKLSYLSELTAAAAAGAEVLVAIAWVPAAEVFIREALANGLFEEFLFADATASIDLLEGVGTEVLEGMKGTAPEGAVPGLGTAGSGAHGRAFAEAFTDAYGEPPKSGLEASAYDIAVCLCLAAERAGSTAGDAIRDALPAVCSGAGEVFGPGAVAAAMAAVRNGREVNYDGASNAIEWDQAGDIASGFVIVWQFSGGRIVEVDQQPFASSP